MEDQEIIELYWQRKERAIQETQEQYGHYCHTIAYHILRNHDDSEECVNDTYMQAWNSIPPKRPAMLKSFLGCITRNVSLNRYEHNHAQKRGEGNTCLLIDELEECIPDQNTVEDEVSQNLLKDSINRFLSGIKKQDRIIFMQRYWYAMSISEIAKQMNFKESRIKMSLLRSRKKLKTMLESEEF